MTKYSGIMIYSNASSGKLPNNTKELIGAGNELAKQVDEILICVLLGDELEDASKEAIAYGADLVLTVSDPTTKDGQVDALIQILEHAIKMLPPRIVLIGQNDADLACRLSFRLHVGLSTDCIGLAIDPDSKSLVQTRTMYGGKALAKVGSCQLPQIATLRPKAFSPKEPNEHRGGEVRKLQIKVNSSQLKTRVIQKESDDSEVKVEDASIIVCGGRGLGGPEPFQTALKDLADVLNGVVGASRPPADNGWVSKALHIGLTGKIVAPDLYFAIAVSGASQHIAGCSGAKTIVAINKDREANIFREADYGVVGSYEEVLPALTEKLKQLMTQEC